MWVSHSLKCPDEGALVALTRVDADGNTHPLGYISLPFREGAADALEAELSRRDQYYGLDNWGLLEVIDFVLAEMHTDLPAAIDRDPEASG